MKFIVFKKGALIALAAILCLGVAIGICCGAAAATTASTTSVREKVVVIDAGHGGMDAGVYGINTKTKESDINLALAKQLKGYFANAGFKVVMTRKTNAGLYGAPTKGFKMRDMEKRKQIIEESGADMVISIHQNFCPIPSKRGGTVFFDKSSESGTELAQCIQKELNGLNSDIKANEALAGDYYMLKCTQSPSVIVECGFLSNTEDERLLTSSEHRKEIAYSIFKGAISYYS